ncbi:DUF5337 domain-containing protein [Oceaniglobus indicus]|uniref:DUF5337 domain-containing protein n=1 Tax=Oceaniglobus indicus TaxID=2047749 RepID=UPI001304452C|nr:DUF5337 domain-containing protein [Oceaniglobus indicus]
MKPKPDPDLSLARQQRTAGLTIAAAMLIWLGAQAAGQQGILPVRWLFLFDFATLAAMVWAMVVTYRVWRARRDR